MPRAALLPLVLIGLCSLAGCAAHVDAPPPAVVAAGPCPEPDDPILPEVDGETSFDELHITISGSITMENAAEVLRELDSIFDKNPLKNVLIDLKKVTHSDSSAAAVMAAEVNLTPWCASKCDFRPRRISMV